MPRSSCRPTSAQLSRIRKLRRPTQNVSLGIRVRHKLCHFLVSAQHPASTVSYSRNSARTKKCVPRGCHRSIRQLAKTRGAQRWRCTPQEIAGRARRGPARFSSLSARQDHRLDSALEWPELRTPPLESHRRRPEPRAPRAEPDQLRPRLADSAPAALAIAALPPARRLENASRVPLRMRCALRSHRAERRAPCSRDARGEALESFEDASALALRSRALFARARALRSMIGFHDTPSHAVRGIASTDAFVAHARMNRRRSKRGLLASHATAIASHVARLARVSESAAARAWKCFRVIFLSPFFVRFLRRVGFPTSRPSRA